MFEPEATVQTSATGDLDVVMASLMRFGPTRKPRSKKFIFGIHFKGTKVCFALLQLASNWFTVFSRLRPLRIRLVSGSMTRTSTLRTFAGRGKCTMAAYLQPRNMDMSAAGHGAFVPSLGETCIN